MESPLATPAPNLARNRVSVLLIPQLPDKPACHLPAGHAGSGRDLTYKVSRNYQCFLSLTNFPANAAKIPQCFLSLTDQPSRNYLCFLSLTKKGGVGVPYPVEKSIVPALEASPTSKPFISNYLIQLCASPPYVTPLFSYGCRKWGWGGGASGQSQVRF